MMVLPFQVSSTEYSLFVILQDENLDRMRVYDPAEITISKLSSTVSGLDLKDVIIGYATRPEAQEVVRLCVEGKIKEALRMLSRGWRYRPELGDYDGPYLSMRQDDGDPS